MDQEFDSNLDTLKPMYITKNPPPKLNAETDPQKQLQCSTDSKLLLECETPSSTCATRASSMRSLDSTPPITPCYDTIKSACEASIPQTPAYSPAYCALSRVDWDLTTPKSDDFLKKQPMTPAKQEFNPFNVPTLSHQQPHQQPHHPQPQLASMIPMPTMSNMPISQQCPSSEPQPAPQKLPPHLQYFHDLFNNPAASQPGMGMPCAPNPQAMQALQAIMASKRAAPTAAPIPGQREGSV